MATLKEAINTAKQEPNSERSQKLLQAIKSGKMDQVAQSEGIDLSPIKGVSVSTENQANKARQHYSGGGNATGAREQDYNTIQDIGMGAASAVAQIPEAAGNLFRGIERTAYNLHPIGLAQRGLDAILGTDYFTPYDETNLKDEGVASYIEGGGEKTTKILDQGIEAVAGKNESAKETGKFITNTAAEIAPYLVPTPDKAGKLYKAGQLATQSLTSSGVEAAKNNEDLSTGKATTRLAMDAGMAMFGPMVKEVAKKVPGLLSGASNSSYKIAVAKPDLVKSKAGSTWGDLTPKLKNLYKDLFSSKSKAYQEGIKLLEKSTATVPKKEVKKQLSKVLKEFKVNVKAADDFASLGDDIFAKSDFRFNDQAHREVKKILAAVEKNADDLSMIELDSLKKSIDTNIKLFNDAPDALSAKMQNVFRKNVEKNVPKIKEINLDYGETMDILKEMRVLDSSNPQRIADFSRRLLNPAKEETFKSFKNFLKKAGDESLLDDIAATKAAIEFEPILRKFGAQGGDRAASDTYKAILGSSAAATGIVGGSAAIPGLAALGAGATASSPALHGKAAMAAGQVGKKISETMKTEMFKNLEKTLSPYLGPVKQLIETGSPAAKEVVREYLRDFAERSIGVDINKD